MESFVVAIDVAVSCRPAGLKSTETIAFAVTSRKQELAKRQDRRCYFDMSLPQLV